MKGLIFDIKRFAINDGPGIRTTVFLKGCPLDCRWCHNPEGKSMEIEETPATEKSNQVSYHRRSIGRRWIDSTSLVSEILKDEVFYQESGGGVTFSGGEPLMQPDFLLRTLLTCKTTGIRTAVDTCGYADSEKLKAIMPYTDLFLYDLKVIDPELHLKYTGVSNELILKNLELIADSGASIIIRIPVVRGVNDTPENISGLIRLLASLSSKIEGIHLLSYHHLAKSKYEKLGKPFDAMEDFEPGDIPFMKKQLEREGFQIKTD